jgi:hypothetical protein
VARVPPAAALKKAVDETQYATAYSIVMLAD